MCHITKLPKGKRDICRPTAVAIEDKSSEGKWNKACQQSTKEIYRPNFPKSNKEAYSEESDSNTLSSLKDKTCTIFLYLLFKLLNKLHHPLLWASSMTQIRRGKTTALMLALSKIVRILRLGPNVFSRVQRYFLIVKGPHKSDLNYEFPKNVAGRRFSKCYLQRKLSNGEVMQRE